MSELALAWSDGHVNNRDYNPSGSRKTCNRYGEKETGVLFKMFAAVNRLICTGDTFNVHSKDERREAERIIKSYLQTYPNLLIDFLKGNHDGAETPDEDKHTRKFRENLIDLSASNPNLKVHDHLILGNTLYFHGHDQMHFEVRGKKEGMCVVKTMKGTVEVPSEKYIELSRALLKTPLVQAFIHSPEVPHKPGQDLYVFFGHSHKNFHRAISHKGFKVHFINLGALLPGRGAFYQLVGYDDDGQAFKTYPVNPATNGKNTETLKLALFEVDKHSLPLLRGL